MGKLVNGERKLDNKGRLNLSTREKAIVKAFLSKRRESAIQSMKTIADNAGIPPHEWDEEMAKYYKWCISIFDWCLKTLDRSERVNRGNRKTGS